MSTSPPTNTTPAGTMTTAVSTSSPTASPALSKVPSLWHRALFGLPEETTYPPRFPVPSRFRGFLRANLPHAPYTRAKRAHREYGAQKFAPTPRMLSEGSAPSTHPPAGRCASHAITFLFAYQVTGPGRALSHRTNPPQCTGPAACGLRSALAAQCACG